MKVYIFGAGASLGSQSKDIEPNLKAPLIDNVFDADYEEYADALYIDRAKLREIKSRIGDAPLEEWLTKEWDRIHEPHGKEVLSAGLKTFGDLSLYTWWLMTNISTTYDYSNGYHRFLQKLVTLDDKEEKAYINFNYDLLLDKAFEKVLGYDLSSMITNYTTHNYLKPHGSVNWFVKMRPSASKLNDADRMEKEIIFSRIAGEMFRAEPIEKRLIIVDPLNPKLNKLSQLYTGVFDLGEYGFPLVLLPLSTKMDDLISGFMDTFKAELPRIFEKATEIYLIGYRGRDDLVKEMFSYVPPGTKIHSVGLGHAKEVQDHALSLHSNLVAGDVYTDGFSNFVDNMK
jgi:hypothetical protein